MEGCVVMRLSMNVIVPIALLEVIATGCGGKKEPAEVALTLAFVEFATFSVSAVGDREASSRTRQS